MHLGRQASAAQECFENNFVGVDFSMDINLENDLPDDPRKFNKKFVPILLEKWSVCVDRVTSKITASLASGTIYTMSKGINIGDYLLCSDGQGTYKIAEVTGDYFYQNTSHIRHCRPVAWLSKSIRREDMSEKLRRVTGLPMTVCNVTPHAEEINSLVEGISSSPITSTDPIVEDPSEFALEKHLEDFLIANWNQTELAQNYDIYKDEEFSGQQFLTDTGPIDILAISKDAKELLVIELKKGRASDSVVGQIQRYMGYIKEEIAEDDQKVKGVIIAFEDDLKIKRALSVTQAISFYTYKINFRLQKILD